MKREPKTTWDHIDRLKSRYRCLWRASRADALVSIPDCYPGDPMATLPSQVTPRAEDCGAAQSATARQHRWGKTRVR